MGVTNEALELQSSVLSLLVHLIDPQSPSLSHFFNLFHPLCLSLSLPPPLPPSPAGGAIRGHM